uniref:BTB domain-containing protein n=1 Tax=Trichobilharzia regenti TaxID=157069 RepID=A0AA85JX64_TRIRE|nr:unnamed protein product [Trichobilharzia regenti]
MCALVNTQRASSKKAKAKIFEYFCKDLSSSLERISNSTGTSDVIFVVGRNVYHGHQKTLSLFSEKLKKCFQLENGEADYTHNNDCLLKVTRSESSNSLKIFIDAPVDAFEVVLNYMSTLKLTVPEELMPAVYYLSKGLQIPTLQKICTEFLINNLSINFVGVLCRFVQFNGLYTKSNEYTDSDELCLSEICLAKSLHHYLLTEADKIACSQTGILSARLIVNLTGNFNSSSSEDQGEGKCQEPSSEYLAFGVLRWAFERLLTGERLARAGSDDNVYSDDEESDGNSSSHAGENSSASQRKRAGSHFQFLAQKNLLSRSRSKDVVGGGSGGISTPQDDLISDEDDADAETEVEERACISNNLDPLRFFSTQDIRISLDINDLLLGKDENCRSKVGSQDINGSQGKNSLLTVCLTTGSQASETCLLAPTTLGVSSTSIWLGKLAGYLVSLSIKRCHPAYRSIQQLDEELMLEVNQSRSRHQSRGSSLPNHNTSMPCGLNNCVENGLNVTNSNGNDGHLESPTHSCLPAKMESDDEVCRTMTANSALHLARAAAVASVHESFSGQIYQSELLCCGGVGVGGSSSTSTDGAAMDTPMRMLEARSGFGVGHLTCDDDSKRHIVIVGGYTRKGCLDSVEIFTENNNNNSSELCSDEDCPVHPPVAGPRLTKQRGRLAVVSSYLQSHSNSPDVIYACGGSTGSKDLASVDRLTSESLKSWFANHEATKNGHTDNINTVEYTNGSHRSTETRLRTDSLVHTNNGTSTTNGSAPANISFWQPIKSLHEARTNPVAVDLSGLHQGPLISNAKGSILVAGGVCGAQYLSSVEAYIPDKDEWVYMPSMLQGRREACASVLTTRNLIVVIGGVINTNSAYRSSANITVEALDPRCAAWFYIPNPLANSIGQLRSASLTYCPNIKDNLLLVGGYNGNETLDATWIFDSAAWKWRSGPNLLFARSSCGATLTSDQRCNLIFGGYNPTKSSCGFLDTIEVIF